MTMSEYIVKRRVVLFGLAFWRKTKTRQNQTNKIK
jgi:hypothetical protein